MEYHLKHEMTDPELEREIKKYTITAMAWARGMGGSKSKRALWDICGKPMIQWVIESILKSKYVDRMYVATEDKEIGAASEKCGAKVIYRPIDTVLDYPRYYTKGPQARIKPRSNIHQNLLYLSPPWNYSLHYLEEVEGYVPDILITVSTDSPLTKTASLDRLIRAFFKDPEASCAKMLYSTEPKIYMINPKTERIFPFFVDTVQGIDRQEYPDIYRGGGFTVSGGFLVQWSGKQKYAHIFISPEEGLSVHDKEDLFLARCYMKRRLARSNEQS